MDGPRKSQVFLSYARADGAEAATELERRLAGRLDYTTWLDKREIAAGDSWTEEIERAIDGSDFVLALLTPGAFRSDICRAEQLRALRKRKIVIPVLAHSEPDVPLHLETKHYINFVESSRRDTAFEQLLARMAARDSVTLPERYRSTRVTRRTIPVWSESFVARPDSLAQLKALLIGDSGSRARIAVLRDMPGTGKTVLASAICHDEAIQAAFPDGIVWLTIGRERTADAALRDLKEAAQVLDEPLSEYQDIFSARQRLRTTLADKAVLLVLDDVWSPHDVEVFRADAPRSRILITARDGSVAAGLGATEINAGQLTQAQALAVLASWANRPVSELEPEVLNLPKACGYLPLTLATLGAMMRGMPSAFCRMLPEILVRDLESVTQDFPDYPYPSLFAAIDASLSHAAKALPSNLNEPDKFKASYLTLAVFPKKTSVPVSALAVAWELSDAATMLLVSSFARLSLGSLDSEGRLALHDLQHDFARCRLSRADATAVHARFVQKYREKTGLPNDGYCFQHFALHVLAAEGADSLKALLLDGHWIRQKLDATDVNTLLVDYQRLSGDTELRVVEDALRLAAHVIIGDKAQLPGQLLARLPSLPALANLSSALAQGGTQPWLKLFTPNLTKALAGVRRRFLPHDGFVGALAVIQGDRIASATSDGALRSWDLETMRELPGHAWRRGSVDRMAAAGGQLFSMEWSGELWITDLETWRHADVQWRNVAAFAVTPDGKLLIVAKTDESVCVRNLEQGSEHELGLHKNVSDLSVSHDGRLAISVSFEGEARIWDLAQGTCRRIIELGSSCDAVALTPGAESFVVSIGWKAQVALWDVSSGSELRVLDQLDDPVVSLAIAPDGAIAAVAGGDGTVRVLDLTGKKAPRILGRHGASARAVAFVDASRLVSCSHDGNVGVWSLDDAPALHLSPPHPGLCAFAALGDSRVFAGAVDGAVSLWSFVSGERLWISRGPGGWIDSMRVARDRSKGFTIDKTRSIQTWDLSGETPLSLGVARGRNAALVAVSRDGKKALFATNEGTALEVVELESMLTRVLEENATPIMTLAISNDGRCAVIGHRDERKNQYLEAWNLDAGTALWRVDPEQYDLVSEIVISCDGATVASGAWGGQLKFWDMLDGREHQADERRKHARVVRPLVASPTARVIVSAGAESMIYFWDLDDPGAAQKQPCAGAPKSMKISDDGTRLWMSSESGAIEVWSLTPRFAKVAALQMESPCSLTFVSADGIRALGHEDRSGDFGGHPVFLELAHGEATAGEIV